MDPIDSVFRLFSESAELNLGAAQAQAPAIVAAAHSIVSSLLGGGKILCCGNGGSAADAQYFAALMQHRFERVRPGLPALSLTADATTLTAIASEEGLAGAYAVQVNTLGRAGDVLLLFNSNADLSPLTPVARAAAERDMRLILIGSSMTAETTKLTDGDIEICAPTASPARVAENHRLVTHCLLELIDLQLMGG